MPTAVQFAGTALVVAALVALAGPWWACLTVGVALVTLGYLAERASGPRGARSDRRDGPNTEGVE